MHKRYRWLNAAFAMLLLLGLAAAGCAGVEEEEEAMPAEEPVAEPAPAALDRSVLEDETRPEDEVAQDASRKAIDVYEFLGLQPGMSVADVWPGGGYNTHLLSRLVGAEGKVHAIMGFYTAGQFATLEPLTARVADAHLDNVEIVLAFDDMEPDTVDLAITVRNYHDQEDLSDGRQAAADSLYQIVKPGGVVGIVEVATDREGWDTETHRLNEATVIEEFIAAGFALEDRSDMLANPEDDHSTTGFTEGRHTMDRYLLKFRKPDAGGEGDDESEDEGDDESEDESDDENDDEGTDES